MKPYYAPGACSLASHIALREAGFPFDSERVDLKSKATASGADFNRINAKGKGALWCVAGCGVILRRATARP